MRSPIVGVSWSSGSAEQGVVRHWTHASNSVCTLTGQRRIALASSRLAERGAEHLVELMASEADAVWWRSWSSWT
jgi:hypothetical protein